MTVFGNDLSTYQPNIPMARLMDEGSQYFFGRCSRGAGYVDPSYKVNLAQAEVNRSLFAAYHFTFQGIKASYSNQADTIEEALAEDKSIPLWFDVEESTSGGKPSNNDALEVARLMIDRKYDVQGAYFPMWYWDKTGRPSLLEWKHLMASRYVKGYTKGSLQKLYPGDAYASLWQGYGGLDPVIAQYTSSMVLPGYTANTVDADAYRGTFQQLRDSGMFRDFGVEQKHA